MQRTKVVLIVGGIMQLPDFTIFVITKHISSEHLHNLRTILQITLCAWGLGLGLGLEALQKDTLAGLTSCRSGLGPVRSGVSYYGLGLDFALGLGLALRVS